MDTIYNMTWIGSFEKIFQTGNNVVPARTNNEEETRKLGDLMED